MLKRIIFYTDCYTFGGCEKAIFEIMTSKIFNLSYDYLLVYRFSKEYKNGMNISFPSIKQNNIKRVYFPDLNTWYFSIEQAIANTFLLKVIKGITSLLFHLLMPLLFIYEYIYLYLLFAKIKSNIIHVNNGGYPGALSCRAAIIAAKCSGKKRVLLSIHNIASRNSIPFDKIIDFFVKRCVSVIIAVSEASATALRVNRGFDKNKIMNVYLGVKEYPPNSMASFTKPGINRHICMVGRFEERKGHKYALLAFKKIIFEHPDYSDLKLLLIGDGPLLNQIKAIVSKEGIGKNVVFLGYRKDAVNYMASSLFLLHPSLAYESLPYSILEAMSVGIPVIGTEMGGIPEEIDNGVTGIIVPAANIEKLAWAMLSLLQDSQKRREMGFASKKRFSNLFTLDRMIGDYMKLYGNLS